MSTLLKFEVVKHEPYRFIGKSIYARAGMQCGQGNFCDYLWSNSKWVFEHLDGLKGYATDEVRNAALLTWEKYDDKTKLLGYTVGRFMKADTPAPNGMDYFDIADGYVAKGYFDSYDGNEEGLMREAIEKHGEYSSAHWRFMVEIGEFEKELGFVYYISCDKK